MMVRTLIAVGYIVVIILWGIERKSSQHLRLKMESNIKTVSFLRNKVIEFSVKIYLQVLFFIGAFRGRSWVDKHIKLCYNKLDEINSDYDKVTRNQWYR